MAEIQTRLERRHHARHHARPIGLRIPLAQREPPLESDYLLHGLRVRSSIGLCARETVLSSAPDVSITSGAPRVIVGEPPRGRIIAELNLNGTGYAVAQHAAGYTIRFYATCEAIIDPALEHIRVHRAQSCSEELVGLLLEGPVLSTLLTLKGHAVLHASAIQLGGRSFAFIGPSGRGKSTLAAALCRVGARLISDDTLRCDVQGDRIVCFPATRSLRLRPTATLLATAEAPTYITVDGRLGLSPALVDDGTHTLNAVFVPKSAAPGEAFTIARLSGVNVMTQLAAGARVTCWLSSEMRSRQFSLLATLAQTLPVFALSTPRDIVFSEAGREELASALSTVKLQPR